MMATTKQLLAAERAAALQYEQDRRERRVYGLQLRDEQRECLAFGHDWPRLKIRNKARGLPRGFRAERVEGGWQLVESCLNNCGKERISTHTPGQGTERRYLTDERKWKTRPEGMTASRADFYSDLVEEFLPDA
jgi:hypothetical protein